MVVEIIQREIPLRGVGYIILRDCPEERLDEGLKRGMEKLKKAGAKTVLATSLPEGEPLNPGPVGVWRLTHVHDILRLERPLPTEKPALKLNIRAPKRSSEDNAWLELVNRSYLGVPNAATRQPNTMRLQNHRYALCYGEGGKPIGAYELDMTDSKAPELLTLCVDPDLRRRGIGRSLLRAALDSLGPKTPGCCLTVSSINVPALSLYESEGFAQTGIVTSWFEVI